MKPLLIGLLVLLGIGGWIGTVVASRQSREDLRPLESLGANTPIQILEAHAFVLDEPFVHEWRAEKPLVRAGYLLLLEAEPELARTRQTFEPVLYVGRQTAERLNAPVDGRMLVLVPAPVGPQGNVELDLASAPIWFGSLELPERIDARRIAQELTIALREGVGPARMAATALTSQDADPIRAATRRELDLYVEDMLARVSDASSTRRDDLAPR